MCIDIDMNILLSMAGRQVGGWVGRQAGRYFSKFLKFNNFNSKARLGCLNGLIALIASYQ